MAPRRKKCAFMGIPRNSPSGTVSVLLVKTSQILERQTVQWIDGSDKTSRMGVGDEDLGVKPSENESVVIRGAPQIDVQRLEPEEQPASQKCEQEMQEALSDPEEKTQEAPSDSKEETRKVPSDPKEETREASSDHEKEAKDAAGPMKLEGLLVPALRKPTISGNLPIMSSRTRSQRVHTGVEGAALQSLLRLTKGGDEEGDEGSTSVYDGGGPKALQMKVDTQQSIVGDIPPEPKNRKQTMHSSEWDEWRKAEEVEMHGIVENCVNNQAARPKDKLVVGTIMPCKKKDWTGRRGREVQGSTCRSRVLASRRGARHGKVLTHPSGHANPNAFGNGSS